MNALQEILRVACFESETKVLVEMFGQKERDVSKAEFKLWVGQAQHFFKERKLKRKDRVVLIASNSAKWMAMDIAAMTYGLVMVPLYHRQTLADLVFMVQDAQAAIVMVDQDDLADQLRAQGVLGVSGYRDVFQGPAVEPVCVELLEQDLVSLVYTSGTSGKPKGVMVSRKNLDFMLAHTSRQLDETVGLSRDQERTFHFLPLCFMGSRVTALTQMYRHQVLHLSTQLEQLKEELKGADPHYFLNVPAILERIRAGVEKTLCDKGGWVWNCYRRAMDHALLGKKGSAYFWLARKVIFPKIKANLGKSLKFLICGSAPLHELTQKWFETLGIPVLQVYGLTETTAIISMDAWGKARPGYVGLPIAACDLKLSEEGELLCRGPNVFMAYWNRPEDTQQMFEEGWLRTGDRVEFDELGRIKVLGRVKNLIVSESGHNIVPEIIEEELMAMHEGIGQVVVVGHGKPFLTAVVTGTISQVELKLCIDKMNAELPHYRKIRSFHLSQEPFTPDNGLLTANHKPKRQAIEDYFQKPIAQMYQGEARAL